MNKERGAQQEDTKGVGFRGALDGAERAGFFVIVGPFESVSSCLGSTTINQQWVAMTGRGTSREELGASFFYISKQIYLQSRQMGPSPGPWSPSHAHACGAGNDTNLMSVCLKM